MIALAATLAVALLIAGGGCLYLTTTHQRLLAAPLPLSARAAGWVCLLAALAILLTFMGPATAVFTWTIGLMMAWTIPPIAIGWLRYRKETRPRETRA